MLPIPICCGGLACCGPEHLVAVTDDDGINAEIAVRAQGVLRQAGDDRRGRARPLTCTVHLVDPQLYELARTRELALEEGVPLRLELFNVFERGARLLWSKYGPPGAGMALRSPRISRPISAQPTCS